MNFAIGGNNYSAASADALHINTLALTKQSLLSWWCIQASLMFSFNR